MHTAVDLCAYHLYKLLTLQLKLDTGMTAQCARRCLLDDGQCFWNLSNNNMLLDLPLHLNILSILHTNTAALARVLVLLKHMTTTKQSASALQTWGAASWHGDDPPGWVRHA